MINIAGIFIFWVDFVSKGESSTQLMLDHMIITLSILQIVFTIMVYALYA